MWTLTSGDTPQVHKQTPVYDPETSRPTNTLCPQVANIVQLTAGV